VDGPPDALYTTGGHAGGSRLAFCTTRPAGMRRRRGEGARISAEGRARAPCLPAGSRRARRTRMYGRCWSSRGCTQPRASDSKIACRACEGGGARRTIDAWRRWVRRALLHVHSKYRTIASEPECAPAVAPVWQPAPTRPVRALTRARHAAGGKSLQEPCATAALRPTGGAGARACPQRSRPRRPLLHPRTRAWKTTVSQRQ